MALGQGDNDPGGTYSSGGEVPEFQRRLASGFGNSPQVAADVARQNEMNQGDPLHWLTNASQIADSPWLMGLPQKVTGAFQNPNGPVQGIGEATGILSPIPSGGGGWGPEYGNMSDPFAGMFGGNGGGGGYQGVPIQGAEGLNFLKPGAAEQFFNDVGGRFKDPTKSEQFANAAFDTYGIGGTPVSNRADEAYKNFQNSTPADMSGYYNNAERRAQEALDRTMAEIPLVEKNRLSHRAAAFRALATALTVEIRWPSGS